MATINLGRIKPVFKGAYASGTAYVVDDIVVYSDESYICIQAGTGQTPSSATAYWTKMAAKGTNGTNGTDVGTVLTTQGDILYRDGSGLQRLAKGTAGQALLMNTSANAPEWGAAGGGKVLQVVQATKTDSTLSTSSSYVATGLSVDITPSASTSKVLVLVSAYVDDNANGTQSYYTIYRGSTNLGHSTGGMLGRYVGGARSRGSINMNYLDTPNATSATTYQVYFRNGSGSNIQINSESSTITIIAMEIGA